MLFYFLLKRFYIKFIIFFIVLMLIFALSDLFIRLPINFPTYILFKIFILMMPLMAQFSFPLASCLSIQTVIGEFYVEDEIVFFYFFSKAKSILYKTVLFFSLSLLIVYIPIVISWAPKSYKQGKFLILDLAKKHFSDLSANTFHSLSNNFTLFFEAKTKNTDRIEFSKILLMFKEKKGDRFIINSNRGFIINDILFLENGVIQNVGSKKNSVINFNKTEMDLKEFLDLRSSRFKIKDLKFFTLHELKRIKDKKLLAFIEYHKRIAQIIWQFLFPFLSLFLIMLFARKKSNLLISIFLSGALFLISYILLNLLKILSFLGPIVIIFLYLPIFLIFILIFFFYKKRV